MQHEPQIDQSVIDQIRRRDTTVLAGIYKDVYPMVLKHVLNNNGSPEDAQDIFQDAFYILIKKTEQPDFILTSQLSTFLVGVSKNLWLKKLTQTTLDKSTYKAELFIYDEQQADEDDVESLVKVRRMNFAMANLGEPCKSILINYYYLKQTMQEIAALFHYTNAENAKNQKYKCLQRLKKLVSSE